MTTTIYNVAYPNPSLDPLDRLCRCRVGSETDWMDLLSQLYDDYPKHTEDLKRATLWKAIDLKLEKADVYNVSTQKVYDWIHNKDEGAMLPRGDPLVEYFPDGPHDQSLEQVDIVVVTPEIVKAMERGVAGELRYIMARERMSRIIKRAPSPSKGVKSTAAVMETVCGPGGPRYGRPSDRFGPPTALFSGPLAFLKYDLEHLESFAPDRVTLNSAFELVAIATDFFDEEGKREEALKPILQELLAGKNQPTADNAPKPDGVWFEGPFACLITQLKDDPGHGGDPFLQGLLVYGKTITQEEYTPYLKQSNVPVILLAIAGNRLVVSTAVFTDAIYADKLLSTRLQFGFYASDNVLHVARVFMAINGSMRRLRDLYKDLVGVPCPSPPRAVLWPNPTADPPEFTEILPKLEFFCKVNHIDGAELPVIDEDNEQHAMYLARMEIETSTQVVFVKFAVKYHEDAHRLLANQDSPLAPALYFCARVIGDMYMVVMEYITKSRGQSIDPYSSIDGSPPPQPVPAVVRRDVCKGLDLLHERDLVFGDLRETNLLYLAEDGGRVLFVDFDGVGRDGMDRYSPCLDPAAGLGVARGQVMEKAHDRRNLERLMERLSS
ncbi:hypothetical protein BDM02DRAFT_3190581 [Thelephora ganbajun]|uniref:Uncharacterized protein n=1 Tax=Thelephora ganbajun TaxID=370292 RepID=A0ACB6Z4D4_THEGA|nr:hypothetical protein BDM02DRAFT_3190581 [Thelephora ganbajun]